MKQQSGFTLIELMIVVAIIGILAAIALPAYQSYMTKSKLVEATTLLDSMKNPINEAWASDHTTSTFPTVPPISTTKPTNTKYVNSVAYNTSGTLVGVVLGLTNTSEANIDNHFMGLFGVGNADGTVTWLCGTAAAATDTNYGADTNMYPFLPAACQR